MHSWWRFLLTCLLRGMTVVMVVFAQPPLVSTHMPLARHDVTGAPVLGHVDRFLLTCLLRGMTTIFHTLLLISSFLLTCLLRGMTNSCCLFFLDFAVSTHMPLARHDRTHSAPQPWSCVSTHMPLARHDFVCVLIHIFPYVSTHMPLARHDATMLHNSNVPMFLLTCLLRGMTNECNRVFGTNWVSTHMPLARHDTVLPDNIFSTSEVSTHMPLARHDQIKRMIIKQQFRFYSHASCEA